MIACFVSARASCGPSSRVRPSLDSATIPRARPSSRTTSRSRSSTPAGRRTCSSTSAWPSRSPAMRPTTAAASCGWPRSTSTWRPRSARRPVRRGARARASRARDLAGHLRQRSPQHRLCAGRDRDDPRPPRRPSRRRCAGTSAPTTPWCGCSGPTARAARRCSTTWRSPRLRPATSSAASRGSSVCSRSTASPTAKTVPTRRRPTRISAARYDWCGVSTRAWPTTVARWPCANILRCRRSRIAASLVGVANILEDDLDRPAEALELRRRAIVLSERSLGRDHPESPWPSPTSPTTSCRSASSTRP